MGTELNQGAVRRELGALLTLALPIAAGQVGYALMGLVDTAVVGRLGAGPLGAVGLANALFFAIAVIGMGTMMGLDPLIAQALGAKDERRARELLWQGLWLGAAAGSILAIAVLLSPLLLGPFDIDPAVVRDTRVFLWLRLIGLLPMLWFVGVRSYLQAVGRVASLIAATVVANVLNLFGDILFVYGGADLPAWAGPLRHVPAFGAPGAGLTTALATIAQLLVIAWPASKVKWRGGAIQRTARLDDLRKACSVGIPVGLQMGAEVGVFALASFFAGHFGNASLAAHQVGIAWAGFTFSAAVGIGNAGTVRVGRAIGARDAAGTRRAGLVAFAAGATFMAACGVCFWLFPRAVVRVVSDRPEVIAASLPLIAVAAVFQISDGIQAVGAGVLRGAGDTRFAFLANVVGHYLVGLPLALLLGFSAGKGIVGVWWGLCGGLTAVALGLFGRFWIASSKPIAPLERPAVLAEELPIAPMGAPALGPTSTRD